MGGYKNVAMNIHIDGAIFMLQARGGVSTLWRNLTPALHAALPDATFDADQPPDVFLSTYYRPAPLGVPSVALIYDLIALRYPGLPNAADAADIRRAVREATAVVSISQQTADDVRTLLGRDSAVAYPGVDQDLGKVTPSSVQTFQSSIGKPYVLVIGRRGYYKNVQSIYQAWLLWSGAASHALVCIGGEDSLPQDRAFAARYDWRRLDLDNAHLASAYAGATALVYPSIMEGFGLPIVEAMLCGCPVVCGAATYEVGWDAAIYTDVTLPIKIAGALDACLDPSYRIGKITAGVERARSFTWAKMAETVANVIRSVVNG